MTFLYTIILRLLKRCGTCETETINESQPEPDRQLKSYKRLQRLHGLSFQLLMHEGDLFQNEQIISFFSILKF